MYTPIGNLTHGSIFKASPDGTRRWALRRITEDYAFATPLDLSRAEKISRDDRDDMLSERMGVWVDPLTKGHEWKLVSETGAWSVGPDYLYEEGS